MTEFLDKIGIRTSSNKVDYVFLFAIIILLSIGLLALSSASSYTALINQGSSNYYFVRQLVFAIVGVVVMLFISTIDCKSYEKYGYFIYAIALGVMLLVFVPGLGQSVNGAKRWLNLGILSFQPSELMKPALAIGIATYISKNITKMSNWKGYIVPVLMIAAVCIVMYFQSHLSGALIMVVIGVMVIVVSGVKLSRRLKMVLALIFVAAICIFIWAPGGEYRLERIYGYLNSSEDTTGTNWQPLQSLYAIGSGGLFGVGLGQSRQKYLWLPESQNDFVFSIYAEEFGFVGCAVVVLLFTVFIYRAVLAETKTKDLFTMLVGVGITAMFAFQFIMNIAVVTKLIPTTGMPLPFFSYGGTSLMLNLVSVGILLNITRNKSMV